MSIPEPGTAEIGIIAFSPASASARASSANSDPQPRPALKKAAMRAENFSHGVNPLPGHQASYAPPAQERIAAALERIADALEARTQ